VALAKPVRPIEPLRIMDLFKHALLEGTLGRAQYANHDSKGKE